MVTGFICVFWIKINTICNCNFESAKDAFGDSDALIPDAVFLPKPFSLSALTNTVQVQIVASVLTA
ncbi:MAG: hypothetical protein ACJAVT_002005 [Yoonia sp.]|jgi:hypothetical protein